jgi:hypothetical protein
LKIWLEQELAQGKPYDEVYKNLHLAEFDCLFKDTEEESDIIKPESYIEAYPEDWYCGVIEIGKCVFEWLEDDAVCQLIKPVETIEFADYLCKKPEAKSVYLSSEDASFSSPVYGNGKFITIANIARETITRFKISSNGIDWTEIIIQLDLSTVAFGNGKFIAIGKDMAYSDNGIDWIAMSFIVTPDDAHSMVYIHDRFYSWRMDMGTNVLYYSYNGLDWNTTILPRVGLWRSLSYGNGKFIIINVYVSGISAYSDNGIDWVDWEQLSTIRKTVSVFGNGKWAISYTYMNNGTELIGIVYSSNLIDWTTITLPQPPSPDKHWGGGLIFKAGLFFIISGTGWYVMYSSDLVNWEEMLPRNLTVYSGVVYGDGKFVFTGRPRYSVYFIYPVVTAFSETVIYRRYYDSVLDEEITKSLLTDVLPALTETEYVLLSEAEVQARAEAVVELFDCETEPEYLTEAIIDDNEC